MPCHAAYLLIIIDAMPPFYADTLMLCRHMLPLPMMPCRRHAADADAAAAAPCCLMLRDYHFLHAAIMMPHMARCCLAYVVATRCCLLRHYAIDFMPLIADCLSLRRRRRCMMPLLCRAAFSMMPP